VAFRRFSDSRVVSGDKGRTRFDRFTGFVAVDASDNGVVVTGVVILVGFRGLKGRIRDVEEESAGSSDIIEHG
jgi:hypothetical protein